MSQSISRPLTATQLTEAMKYLGYQITDESGIIAPATEATIAALTGKSCDSVMLSTFIATEYAKHVPATKWTGSGNYCSTCGCPAELCKGHTAEHVRLVNARRAADNQAE